jgi:acyl carrier protein
VARNLSLTELVASVSHVLGSDVEQFALRKGHDVAATPLREMSFDSLAILEFGIYLEETYGISVNPGQFTLAATTTIQDLLDFVNRNVSKL